MSPLPPPCILSPLSVTERTANAAVQIVLDLGGGGGGGGEGGEGLSRSYFLVLAKGKYIFSCQQSVPFQQ